MLIPDPPLDWRLGAEAARWPTSLPSVTLDGERLIQPRFDGLGVANVPATVLDLVAGGAAKAGVRLPPLADSALPRHLAEGVSAVVVLVADGLGHLQLAREIGAGTAPVLGDLLARARSGARDVAYAVGTSVFPTTTVAALGTLSSGATPAEHGLLSYTVLLPERGGVAELIRWGPFDRKGSFSDRNLGGQSPEHFFGAPTIFQRLQAAGIEQRYAVNPTFFAGTALTRMLHQGSIYAGYPAPSSLVAMVPRVLRQRGGAPTYVYAYWPAVDTVTHVRGPFSEEHQAEVAVLDRALDLLFGWFPRDGSTLLLLTADHGHVSTSEREQIRLNDYPAVLSLLRAHPAGERRAPYLYAREGATADLVGVCREMLGAVTAVATRDEAVAAGLFGPYPLNARAQERIGDVILFPRGNLQFSFEPPTDGIPKRLRLPPPPAFRGLHGGLSPEEALVPLLAVRV